MSARLTKAQAVALFGQVDSVPETLLDALGDAVQILHGTRDVVSVLQTLGRTSEAEAVRVLDQEALWAVAAELNEERRLRPS